MIIHNGRAIAGSMDRINVEPFEEYLNKMIGTFSETQWRSLTEAEKASYKIAFVCKDEDMAT